MQERKGVVKMLCTIVDNLTKHLNVFFWWSHLSYDAICCKFSAVKFILERMLLEKTDGELEAGD